MTGLLAASVYTMSTEATNYEWWIIGYGYCQKSVNTFASPTFLFCTWNTSR